MKKNLFKKSLSVFLAVLMLMSCWVFIPGEHNRAEAKSLTINLSGLAAIHNGSGSRADSSKIVICSDGEAGNTTVGNAKFNISSLPNTVTKATLHLSTGNHGGELVKEASVKVFVINPSKNQSTSVGHAVNNIANVYGSNYNAQQGVTNAYNYYGVTESQAIYTFSQNSSSHTVDITNAINSARASGQNDFCLAFIMPAIYKDTSGDTWSDTHIYASGTYLQVEYEGAYGMPEVGLGNGLNGSITTNVSGKTITVKYPTKMYIDITENLTDAGYSINVSCNTNNKMIVYPAVWGGQESDKNGNFENDRSNYDANLAGQNTIINAFDKYGIQKTGPGYFDNETIDKEYTTCLIHNNASNELSNGANYALQGKPKAVGEYRYYLVGNNSIGNPRLTYLQSGGTTNRNDSSYITGNVDFTIVVYNKETLNNTYLKAAQIFNINQANGDYIREGLQAFDNSYGYTKTGSAVTTLKTREVTQTQINNENTALENAIKGMKAYADNNALKNAIANANAIKNSSEYTAKYTPETRAALEAALNNATSSKYYPNAPVYSITDLSDSSKWDFTTAAVSDQLTVNALTADLENALNAMGIQSYSVKFVNAAGNTVSTQTVNYGGMPSVPDNTAAYNDENGHHTYSWPEISAVTGDVTYTEIKTTTKHDMSSSVTTQATCTTDGVKTYTCSGCAYTYTEAIPSKGHTEETVAGKDATCTETGLTEGKKCSVCGTVTVAQQTIDALGHLDANKDHVCDRGCGAAQGTCSDSATDTDHVCDYGCGKVLEKCSDAPNDGNHKCDICDKDNVTEHIKGEEKRENITEATCGSAGKYDSVYYCTECNAEMERTNDVTIAQLPHSWQEATYSWTADGKTCTATRVCANNAEHTESEAATVTSEVTIPATCTEIGTTTYTATFTATWAAEQTKDVKDIPANGHTAGAAATCTTAQICTVCDTVLVAALGHKFGETVTANDAICTTAGNYAYKQCTVCNYYFAATETTSSLETRGDNSAFVIPALGHEFTKETVAENYLKSEADCLNAAEYYKSCSRCGTSSKGQTGEATFTSGNALDHAWSTSYTSNGDGKDDTHYQTCTRENCDAKNTAVKHTWGEGVENPEAGCENTGTMTYTCTAAGCGATYTETVNALGHTEAEAVIENNVAPTCTATGSYDTVVYCSVCKAELSRVKTTVDALGHTFGDVVEAKDATCTEDGNVAYKQCTVCKLYFAEAATENSVEGNTDTSSFVITAPGHKFDQENTDTKYLKDEATCITKGVYYYSCFCGEKGEKTFETETDSSNHEKTTSHEETAPTCTQNGYTAGVYCEACKTWLSGHEVISATNHANKVHHEKVDATCIAEGTIEYWSCPACGKNFSDEACKNEVANLKIAINPANHTELVKTEAKDATCTVDGNIAYWTCKGCGKIYSDESATTEIGINDTVISAKGHIAGEPVIENNVDPNCNDTGSYETVVYCSVCNAELSRVKTTVDALGHNFAEAFTVDKKATCDEVGSKSKHCSRCTETTEVTEIPVRGHNLVDTETEKEATCLEDGVMNQKCNNGETDEYEACEHTATRVIPAKGHAFGDTTPYKAPTCSEVGNESYKQCEICSKFFAADADKTSTEAKDSAGAFAIAIVSDAHSWDEGVVTTNPTCTEKGVKTYTCKHNSSHTRTEDVAALDHKDENKDGYCDECEEITCKHVETVVVNANPANCEYDGYSGDTVCVQCGKEISKGEIIPKTNHSWGGTPIEIIPATCSDAKTLVYKCRYCQKTENRYEGNPDKEAHTIIVLETIEPTCEKVGYIYYICTLCSTSTEFKVIEAKGHIDEDGDGVCDASECLKSLKPGVPDGCSCICHSKGFFMQLIYKIIRFFWKLFKISPSCKCGVVHY